MTREPARSEDARPEKPAPDHILNDPEIRAKIEEGARRAKVGESRRGLSADDLRTLAREQLRVES